MDINEKLLRIESLSNELVKAMDEGNLVRQYELLQEYEREGDKDGE